MSPSDQNTCANPVLSWSSADCTLARAAKGLEQQRPGVPLWHLSLEDFLHWLGAGREAGRANTSIAKDVSHIRGLLEYAWRSGRSERNVLDGFSVQHTPTHEIPKSLTLEEAEQPVVADISRRSAQA
jgi:site-specific recombinase XerD